MFLIQLGVLVFITFQIQVLIQKIKPDTWYKPSSSGKISLYSLTTIFSRDECPHSD